MSTYRSKRSQSKLHPLFLAKPPSGESQAVTSMGRPKKKAASKPRGKPIAEDAFTQFVVDVLNYDPVDDKSKDTHSPPSTTFPDIPEDIFAVVARFLADEVLERKNNAARNTLARLNRTSRLAHEATLPLLYESLDYQSPGYACTRYLDDMAINGPPKGWQFVKYLYLSSNAYTLLKQYQQYTFGRSQRNDEDIDFSKSFPLLVLMSVEQRDIRQVPSSIPNVRILGADIKVEIFRPIKLEQMNRLCVPLHAEHTARRTCLFGVQTTGATNDYGTYRHIHNITQIKFRKDAGFLEPTGGGSVDFRFKCTELTVTANVALHIMDPSPSPLTKATVGRILDVLDVSWNAKHGRHRGSAASLQIHCYPAVMEYITSQLDTRPWLSLDLSIYLLGGKTTYHDMRRNLDALADAFSRNWTYDRDRREHVFVSMDATDPVPAELAGPAHAADKLEIHLEGALVGGQELEHRGEDYGPVGFMLSVRGELFVDHKPTRTLKALEYSRHYPCSHVGVPARLLEEESDGAADFDDDLNEYDDDYDSDGETDSDVQYDSEGRVIQEGRYDSWFR